MSTPALRRPALHLLTGAALICCLLVPALALPPVGAEEAEPPPAMQELKLFPGDPPSEVDYPMAIARNGINGNLWFTSWGNSRIGRVNVQTGEIDTFTDPGVNFPTGIVYASGYMWFLNQGGGKIGRVSLPSGEITMFAAPAGTFENAVSMTVGADGRLWFSTWRGEIGRFDTYTHEFRSFDSGVVGVTQIVRGGGELWFIGRDPGEPPEGPGIIGRLSTSGEVLAHYQHDGVAYLSSIARGPDGRMWVGASSPVGGGAYRAVVVRLDPLTGETHSKYLFTAPMAIGALTHGADGSIWFVRRGSVGRFDMDLNMTLVGGGVRIRGSARSMAASGDGRTLWFPNGVDNTIGRIEVLP
jgi:streptogramin lyase